MQSGRSDISEVESETPKHEVKTQSNEDDGLMSQHFCEMPIQLGVKVVNRVHTT